MCNQMFIPSRKVMKVIKTSWTIFSLRKCPSKPPMSWFVWILVFCHHGNLKNMVPDCKLNPTYAWNYLLSSAIALGRFQLNRQRLSTLPFVAVAIKSDYVSPSASRLPRSSFTSRCFIPEFFYIITFFSS